MSTPLLRVLLPVAIVLSAVVWFWRGPAEPASDLRYLRIAVSGVEGTAFEAGATLAAAISRPPGLPPCAPGRPCGVEGLVALAQSLSGPAEVVQAVTAGAVETGIAPAQVVFGARCPLAGGPPAADLVILGSLYEEALHILVRPSLGIGSVADLRGRRVAIGRTGTEARRLADRVLTAHGLRRADLRMVQEGDMDAVAALRSGEVDALFRIAPLPDPVVADLLAAGTATLLPVQGAAATVLMDMHPFTRPGVIDPSLFGSGALLEGPVETLMQPVVWFARPDLADDLAADLAAALSLPGNRVLLAGSDRATLPPDPSAPPRLAAPLHPGVAAVGEGGTATVLACPAP